MIKACARCNGPLEETTALLIALNKKGMPFLPKVKYCPNRKWWEKLFNIHHTMMWKAPGKKWLVQH